MIPYPSDPELLADREEDLEELYAWLASEDAEEEERAKLEEAA